MYTTKFIIPKNLTPDLVINYVEDLIVNETALECAFEGNRFHDLMRIAIRRNDNAYLANKVAAKHSENKEAIRQKLLDRTNWYLK
ncbi:MAG: RagB/SusD family nutrient uptake outer membrane protein [Paludibacter sp.]|nr:RagB/SusD family nutrient uptake outer membrane protein [Paludibacter sp.]